jgi:hypothetical protein
MNALLRNKTRDLSMVSTREDTEGTCALTLEPTYKFYFVLRWCFCTSIVRLGKTLKELVQWAREGRRPWRLGFPHFPCTDVDGEPGHGCPLIGEFGGDDGPCCAGDGGSLPQLNFVHVKLTCKGKLLIWPPSPDLKRDSVHHFLHLCLIYGVLTNSWLV